MNFSPHYQMNQSFVMSQQTSISSPEVTQERHEAFQKFGYFVAKQLFAAEVCDRICDSCGPLLNEHHCLPVPFRHSDVILESLRSEIFQAYLRLFLNNSKPMLFGGEYFLKPPGQIGFPAHFDNQDLKVNDHRNALIVWIALENVSYENGAVEIFPSSHLLQHSAVPLSQKSGNRPDIIYWGIDEYQLSRLSKPQVVSLAKGDCLFFSSNMVHRSHPNRSDQCRRSLQLTFIANGVFANPGRYQKRQPIELPPSAFVTSRT